MIDYAAIIQARYVNIYQFCVAFADFHVNWQLHRVNSSILQPFRKK